MLVHNFSGKKVECRESACLKLWEEKCVFGRVSYGFTFTVFSSSAA